MKLKSLLVVSAMALSIAGIASAKSWDLILDQPANVGANRLRAGEYAVKVDGSQVVLTDESSGKAVKISVTIEHSDRKFDSTTMETATKDGKDIIHSISLAGSNTKLVLNQ